MILNNPPNKKKIDSFLLSYRLSPLPTKLMEDIRNFYNTKKNGLQKYKQKYDNKPDSIAYFTNDICGYMNEYNAIMNGCVPKFYYTFRRLYQNKDKDDIAIVKYWFSLLKKTPSAELNILWGLLKPSERDEFLSKPL